MNGWQIFVELTGRPPVEIRPGESLVGRSRTCQVHIPETTVSRQHARILSSALGEVTVEDLGSSNGTFVNGEKIEGRRKLSDGDRITVGDADLRMRIVAPVAATEATVRLTLPPLSQIAAAGAPPAMPPMPPAAAPAPVASSLPADALDPWEKTPPAPLELPLQSPPPARPTPPVPSVPPALITPPPPAASVAETIFAPSPRPGAPPPMVPAPPPAHVGETIFAPSPRPGAPPAIAPPPRPAAPPPPPVQVAETIVAPTPRPGVPPPRSAPPPPRPAPPPVAPVAATVAAAPRVMAAPPARRDALPSVTGIDRIPIPEPPAAVLEAAKLERARPAGFWIRVAAALVDAIPAVVVTTIGTVLGFVVHPMLSVLTNLIVLPYSFYVGLYMPAMQGTTIGKKMLGLRIVHPSVKPGAGLGWGVALLRVVGHMVCGFTLGIGYLLVAFTSQKQGLHDLIASTRVVRVR